MTAEKQSTKLEQITAPLYLTTLVPNGEKNQAIQGDHGGQRLHLVDFIFEVPQSCPTVMPFLPYSHQP